MNIDPGNNQFFVETNLPTRISQGLHVNLLEDNMSMNANMYIYIYKVILFVNSELE